MKTICLRVRLKKRSIEGVRNWFNTLKERLHETMNTLKNEEVYVESVFLDRYNDEEFLIYYMKAKDIQMAIEVYKKSTDPIDIFHKNCWNEFCEERILLEELLDIDRIKIY